MAAIRSILAACLVVLVVGLGAGHFPLQEPDEGRYASIAQHVARTGRVAPLELNGIVYFEKPPFWFGLAALSFRALGETELAARLPSVLAAAATVLIVLAWGRRALGERTAAVAVAVLVGLPLFAFFARVAIVDPLLALATTAALAAAWRALDRPRDARPSRRWVLAAWAACGVAFLVKGPVGLVLPAASVVAFVALVRDGGAFRAFAHPSGPLLAFAIAAPAFALVEARAPGFLKEFFGSQNLARFATGGRFQRDRPVLYYVPVIAVLFLPWSLFLGEAGRRALASVRAARRGEGDERDRLRAFLACAVVVPLAILSLARSKLPYYVLPLAPPFALLVADALLASGRKGWGARRLVAFAGIVALGLAALVIAAGIGPAAIVDAIRGGVRPQTSATGGGWRADEYRIRAVQLAVPLGAAILGGLAVAAALAASLVRRERRALAAFVLAAAIVGGTVAARTGGGVLAPSFSAKPLHDRIAELRRPGEPVLAFKEFPRGLGFYLGEPIVLYDAKYDEFGHDVDLVEARGFALQEHPDIVKEFLTSRPSVLVVADGPRRVEEIRALYTDRVVELESVGPWLILRVGGLG